VLGDLEVREPLLGCGQKRRELQPELHVVRGTLLIEPWKVAEGPQELIHLILFGRGASAAELLHRLGQAEGRFFCRCGTPQSGLWRFSWRFGLRLRPGEREGGGAVGG